MSPSYQGTFVFEGGAETAGKIMNLTSCDNHEMNNDLGTFYRSLHQLRTQDIPGELSLKHFSHRAGKEVMCCDQLPSGSWKDLILACPIQREA